MFKLVRRLTGREKRLLLLIMVLVGLLVVNSPMQAANEMRFIPYSDQQLLYLFNEKYNDDNVTEALIYLYAYIQRNPTKYDKNIQGHATAIDKVYDLLLARAKSNEYTANLVRANYQECNKYDCDGQASVGTSNFVKFPENMVRVCEGYNGLGKCSILGVGDYTRWQSLGVANDSISSIWVGDQVEITLCAHSLNHTSECLTLSGVDNDLRNNFVPKGYSIDNNVSTARVSMRPIPGLTQP